MSQWNSFTYNGRVTHADPATESHFPLKFTKVLTKGDKTAMGSKRTKTKKFLIRKLGKAENIFEVVASKYCLNAWFL